MLCAIDNSLHLTRLNSSQAAAAHPAIAHHRTLVRMAMACILRLRRILRRCGALETRATPPSLADLHVRRSTRLRVALVLWPFHFFRHGLVPPNGLPCSELLCHWPWSPYQTLESGLQLSLGCYLSLIFCFSSAGPDPLVFAAPVSPLLPVPGETNRSSVSGSSNWLAARSRSC